MSLQSGPAFLKGKGGHSLFMYSKSNCHRLPLASRFGRRGTALGRYQTENMARCMGWEIQDWAVKEELRMESCTLPTDISAQMPPNGSVICGATMAMYM